MSQRKNTPNINKTFIIEPLAVDDNNVVSACTALFANTIYSCSGDAAISLQTGTIYFNNKIEVNGSISGNTIYSNNFYSGSTNLLDIFSRDNFYITGGTVNGNTLELNRNDDNTVSIDLSDVKFSGGSGNCISDLYVTNIHGCSPITVNDELVILSGVKINTLVNDNTLTEILARDSVSGEIKYRSVDSIISAATSQDTIVTAFTYNDSNKFTVHNSDGSSFSADINVISGITSTGNIVPELDNSINLGTILKRFSEIHTVNGKSTYWQSNTISATTVSATTVNLGLDNNNNIRILNAENSILKNDCLEGGNY